MALTICASDAEMEECDGNKGTNRRGLCCLWTKRINRAQRAGSCRAGSGSDSETLRLSLALVAHSMQCPHDLIKT